MSIYMYHTSMSCITYIYISHTFKYLYIYIDMIYQYIFNVHFLLTLSTGGFFERIRDLHYYPFTTLSLPGVPWSAPVSTFGIPEKSAISCPIEWKLYYEHTYIKINSTVQDCLTRQEKYIDHRHFRHVINHIKYIYIYINSMLPTRTTFASNKNSVLAGFAINFPFCGVFF